ncbi:MAG: transglutaminase domain-containing protein [Vallitaleaceae bacterium]|nr:transglutaminase domain-containing protein [Vallitaleaceae bacterium]
MVLLVLLVYGYGLVFFISCLMGYQVSLIETAFICCVALLISKILFKDTKRAVITVLSLILASGVGAVILNHLERLEWVLEQVGAFIRPYYLSITDEAIEIDLIRQEALMLLIGVCVYQLVYWIKNKKYALDFFLSIAFTLCVFGYFTLSLTSIRDFYGFVLFAGCHFIYYFYHFYSRHAPLTHERKNSYSPYLVISALFIVVVIGMAQLLYLSAPRPFELPKKVGVTQSSSTSKGNFHKIQQNYQYEINESGKLADEFTNKGVELFQVDTGNTHYLKGLVYEIYEKGEWLQANDLLALPYQLEEMTEIKVNQTEQISVHYTRLNSNVIFVGGQRVHDLKVANVLDISRDEYRGTYSITDYNSEAIKEGVNYDFQSVYINPRDEQFVALLKSSGDAQMSLENTAYTMPKGYEDIQELTKEVTKYAFTNYDKVQAIVRYLKENYTYNTKPDISKRGKEDPIRYFLFGNKEGFCQQFATSAVLMMRSINIPARYVRGFYVKPIIDQDEMMQFYMMASLEGPGYKIVTDSNAHAWLEVFFPQFGWTMFEATPGISIDDTDPIQAPVVVSEVEVDTTQKYDNKGLFITLLVLVVCLTIGILIWSAVKMLKSKRYYRHMSPTGRLKVHYHLIMSYLKAVQLGKYPYETPREYSERVDQKKYVHSEYKLVDMMESYENVSYGMLEVSEDELTIFKHYLKDVKKDALKYSGFFKCIKTLVKEFMMT